MELLWTFIPFLAHLSWFSNYHASFADLMTKRQRSKCKADRVLFELADVANAS